MDLILKQDKENEVILEFTLEYDTKVDGIKVDKSKKIVVTREHSTGLSVCCERGVDSFANFTREHFDPENEMNKTMVLELGNFILAKILELPSKAMLPS